MRNGNFVKARTLLTLAGCVSLTVGACEATSRASSDASSGPPAAASAQVARPLVDPDGRPLPGNVVSKVPPPPVDAGADR